MRNRQNSGILHDIILVLDQRGLLMAYTFVTLAQRPELEADKPRLHSESWPEFLLHDPATIRYWGARFATFADFQYVLCDGNQ